LLGLTEAVYCIGIPLENIEILSLGTGTFNLKDRTIDKRKGVRYWLCPNRQKSIRIYEVMSSGQSVYIDNTMKLMCHGAGYDQKGRFIYRRIQEKLEENIPMDATDKNSLDRLANIGQNLFKKNVDLIKPFIQDKIEPYNHNIIK
jgi:hypothetical protein